MTSALRGARLGLIAFLVTVAACRDSLVDPNTDVGLRVWTEVTPRIVSISDTAAVVRIRVYVINPSDNEVTVVSGGPPYRFTGNPLNSLGLWGSVRIASQTDSLDAGPGVDWWGQPAYMFAPHSGGYSEHTFEMKTWTSRALGEYRIRGWFNGREGRSTTLIIKP